MLKTFASLPLLFLAFGITATQAQNADTTRPSSPPTYFAFIHSPGDKWVDSLPSFKQPGIEQHVGYMSGLAAVGKIIMGGPFLNAAGGLMIFKGDDLEEAMEVAHNDPGVRSGLLSVDVRQWLIVLGND